MMKLIPWGKKILVQRDAPVDTYGDTSIKIPDRAQVHKSTAVVLALGVDVAIKSLRPDFGPVVEEGARVYLGSYGGQQVDTEFGERLLLIEEEDIYGLVEDDDLLKLDPQP